MNALVERCRGPHLDSITKPSKLRDFAEFNRLWGPILQADFQEHKYSNFLAPIWRHIWRCTLQPVCSRLFWILSLKQKKGKKKERNAGPPGTLPAETLGKCRVTAKPCQEALGLEGGSGWERPEMRRPFSSHRGGGGWRGGGGEGRHALKTTETQVEMALWEISLSTNKAGG